MALFPFSGRRSQVRRRRRPAHLRAEQLERRLALSIAPGGIVIDDAAFTRAAALVDATALEMAQATRWVVRTSPGVDVAAAAATAGATASRPTGIVADTFVWEFPAAAAGSIGGTLATAAAGRQAGIVAAYPLVARQQQPRLAPSDPLFANQWHLLNTGQGGGTAGVDANVTGVWDTYLGTGITIAIVDDGLQHAHPDLVSRYVAAASYDFNGNDPDPTPPSTDAHGTAAAGVAAATGNNSLGGAGAAPGASLAGIRLIGGPADDLMEASALTFALADVDIYSNSWGPDDSGDQLAGPGPLTLAALQQGVTNGRGGLGTIYVWAAGNGLENSDNVNYDGYANSRFTIAVTAIDNQGNQPFYAEPGAAILVAAPSNGGTLGITTTDLVGASGYNTAASSAGGDYTDTFGGTSSATPLVSGVVALMLEANPDLGWRDVQHVLVDSARRNDPADADWIQNGDGRWVNHKYGFGCVDADAAVALAETWEPVGPEVRASSGLRTVSLPIPDNNATGVSTSFTMAADLSTEWVEVTFSATHSYRGDLEVVLTSPSGTQSVLAETHDDPNANYANWKFTSARHWGESSAGTWTLTVRDLSAVDIGTLDSWTLDVYGTPNIDVVPPAVTVATTGSSTVLVGATRRVNFTLSEPSTTFSLASITTTGGSLGAFTGSGTTYSATFTPAAGYQGTATIAVPANAFTDLAGNANTASNTLLFTVDTVVPTVVITRSGGGTVTLGSPTPITFTINSTTATFTAADIGVTGGSLTGFAGTGGLYTATFTPTAGFQGVATVTVASGVFTSLAGNPNLAASLSFPVDALPPTLAITRSGSNPLLAGEVTTVTFTLSEAGTTFTAGALTVSGGVLSPLIGDGTRYTATFTPTSGFEGVGRIAVAPGAFTDAAGQPAAAATLEFLIDTRPPVVTLAWSGPPLVLLNQTAMILVTLSEPPTFFDATTLEVSGGVLVDMAGEGTVFTATFVPTAGFRGLASIAMAPGAISDIAGNANTTSVSVEIPVDAVKPSITGFQVSPVTSRLGIGDALVIEAAFSESVTPGGHLRIQLTTGGEVSLVVDSGGLTARGTYVAEPGDVSDALDVVGVAYDTPLQSVAGNPLAETLPPPASGLAARYGIVVDAAVRFMRSGAFGIDPAVVRDAGAQFRRVPLRFTTPVRGLSLSSLALHVNGQRLSLRGARLTGAGASYLLSLPVTRGNPVGIYTLSLEPSSGVRATTNDAPAATTVSLSWGFGRTIGLVPGVPTGLTLLEVLPAGRRTAVTLAWQPPAANAGGPITHYVVQYRAEGSQRWLPVRMIVPGGASRVTIGGLAAGQSFEFRIAAANAAGIGDFGVSAPFRVV